jgi:hypothetical protein
MFEDVMHRFRIPHYGCDYGNEAFKVISPSLINNKYVAYTVKGEDKLGPFEGKRRYNEFYLVR